MRALPLLLSLAALSLACGSPGGVGPPKTDAGHDATSRPKEDSAPPDRDDGTTPETSTGCSSVGAVWATMDHQPILLADPKNEEHRTVAGVDIDGTSGTGITVPEVEAILCPGTLLGSGPDGTVLEAWGGSNEVVAAYDPTTTVVQVVSLFPGYLGSMTLPTDPAGPDARHTFTVGLGQVQRDGAPFTIDWTDLKFTAGTQLFNALQYNAAGYPGYDATSCLSVSACPVNTSSGKRQWQLVTINVTLTFGLGGTAAEQSTVVEIDLQP